MFSVYESLQNRFIVQQSSDINLELGFESATVPRSHCERSAATAPRSHCERSAATYIKKSCHSCKSHGLVIYNKNNNKTNKINKTNNIDFHAEIYNCDGSYGGFSGNGARCLGQHIFKHHPNIKKFNLMLGDQIVELEYVAATGEIISRHQYGKIINRPKELSLGAKLTAYFKNLESAYFTLAAVDPIFVDTGNPHCILKLKPKINSKLNSKINPEIKSKANLALTQKHFIKVIEKLLLVYPEYKNFNISMYYQLEVEEADKNSRDKSHANIIIITYERGVGATPACCSALIAVCTVLEGGSTAQHRCFVLPGGEVRVGLGECEDFLGLEIRVRNKD